MSSFATQPISRLGSGNLIEFGYPERFVQDQVGHAYASTTAIYTHVSDEFRTQLIRDALKKRSLWEPPK